MHADLKEGLILTLTVRRHELHDSINIPSIVSPIVLHDHILAL